MTTSRKVFLSSTCYDLVDLRAVLEKWMIDAGYHPLLSDRSSFPCELGIHRHEICTRTVRDADLLVLVVSSRYGAPCASDASMSITQAEWRAARKAHVPVLAFVRVATFNERQTWIKNGRSSDLKWAFADTHKIFEFIDELQRDISGIWIQPFISVLDIADKLNAIIRVQGDISPAARVRKTGRSTSVMRSDSMSPSAIPRRSIMSTAISDAAQRLIRRAKGGELPLFLDKVAISEIMESQRTGVRSMQLSSESEIVCGDEFFIPIPIRPGDEGLWDVEVRPTAVGFAVLNELDGIRSSLQEQF